MMILKKMNDEIARNTNDMIYEFLLDISYQVLENDKVIANIAFSKNKSTIYIEKIETILKNQGNGTKILEFLFNNCEIIEGDALYNAIGFWEKVGATFKNNNFKKEDSNFFYLTKQDFFKSLQKIA